MNYIDSKYIDEVAPYLKNFQKKHDRLWNFRCPYCNDSKKNSRISRGYFFVGKDQNVIYSCHNCNIGDGGVSLSVFIKDHFPTLYTQYKLERMRSRKQPEKLVLKKTKSLEEIRKNKILTKLTKPIQTVQVVSDLPPTHEVYKYLQSRMLPDLSRFSYTTNFRRYVAEITNNDSRYERLPEDSRIIIPIKSPTGELWGVQGRALPDSKSTLRYITIKLDEGFSKIYGLDKYNKNKPGFIVEGPFDSEFLPNSIAMCGASFDYSAIDNGLVIPENTIVVYDNESRNKDIVNRMMKMVDAGFRVFVPPNGLNTTLKDINKMVQEGVSPNELVRMFIQNSHKGIKAKLAINRWKKVE